MGIDLTLLPLWDRDDLNHKWILCYDRLRLERDYELFSQLAPNTFSHRARRPKTVIEPSPLSDGCQIDNYEDEGIKKRDDDAYGTRLTYLTAGQFKTLKLSDDASVKNRAAMAYVAALPDDWPVILYWH